MFPDFIHQVQMGRSWNFKIFSSYQRSGNFHLDQMLKNSIRMHRFTSTEVFLRLINQNYKNEE